MINIDVRIKILIITDNTQKWIDYIKNNILNTRCSKLYGDNSYQIIAPMFTFDISDDINSYCRNRYSTIVVDKILPKEYDKLSILLSFCPIKYTTNYHYLKLKQSNNSDVRLKDICRKYGDGLNEG